MKSLSFQEVRGIFEDFPEGEQAPFLEQATRKAERRLKGMKATMRGIMRQVSAEPPETHPLYKSAIETFLVPELSQRIKALDVLERLKATLKGDDKQARFSELIDRAKQVDIVDVAESLDLDVRRRGRNYVALCPFHAEKTPSFVIYPGQNRFFCYGCQASGDTLDLYQRIRGVDFKQAVKELVKW